MSPRTSAELAGKGPAALRNELAAAKKAVEVLKGEKEHTQAKLEKLHAVLEKERSALRDVLSAARKAVDDLKVEKQQVETDLEQANVTIEELRRQLAAQGSSSVSIESITIQLREANTTIDSLRMELASAKREASSNSAAEELRSQLQSQMSRMREDNDRERKRFQDELAELRRKLAEAEKAAASASSVTTTVVSGGISQEDYDNLKMQMEGQFRRLQMRLSSTRKESGTRWMNQILARWRLHNVVSFLHFWRAVTGNKGGAAARPAAATGLTEKALEAELRALEDKLAALKKQLAVSEQEKSDLEGELQEALQVLEKGMAELKAEKAAHDAQLEKERANFLQVMREAERDRKQYQEEIASLQLTGGGGDVAEERRQKLEWKREAERTAELFDEKKVQFDLAMRDAEFKQQLLRKQLGQAEADLTASKDELFHCVGDLAHLQNEASNNRKLAETLEKRNQQLESLVTRHVVDGRVLSGFLLKQGSQVSTRWHQRFCILDGAALSLYTEKPTTNQEIAKTIIPLMKVKEVKASPSEKKYAFRVSAKDGTDYIFDCENAENLKQWLTAVEQMMLSNTRLTEDWEQIKVGYADDMQLLRDRILVLEQQLTDVKEVGVHTANEALKNLQSKYDILEMSLSKMDDDLWLWIDRNMWRTTSVHGMGFGNDVGNMAYGKAMALGGSACDAVTTVSWEDEKSGGKFEAIHTEAHAFSATDKKEKVYTVNFTAPHDSKAIVAVVKIEESKVFEAPSVPERSTPEVKKLQRLMTLRNPSPPRSRQDKRAAEKKSPRGKSPPKQRSLNLGSLEKAQ